MCKAKSFGKNNLFCACKPPLFTLNKQSNGSKSKWRLKGLEHPCVYWDKMDWPHCLPLPRISRARDSSSNQGSNSSSAGGLASRIIATQTLISPLPFCLCSYEKRLYWAGQSWDLRPDSPSSNGDQMFPESPLVLNHAAPTAPTLPSPASVVSTPSSSF